MKLLLENQTTDGSSESYELNQSGYRPEYISAVAYGTWDGATCTLEFSVDSGTTWITAGDDTTLSDDGGGNFWMSGKVLIRFTLSGAGASTDVTAGLI